MSYLALNVAVALSPVVAVCYHNDNCGLLKYEGKILVSCHA
jgi:hypothetical protein